MMEVHENACYRCGGTVEGPIQSGWFKCRACGTEQPRYALRHAEPLTGHPCPVCGGWMLEGEAACIQCAEDAGD